MKSQYKKSDRQQIVEVNEDDEDDGKKPRAKKAGILKNKFQNDFRIKNAPQSIQNNRFSAPLLEENDPLQFY